MSRAFMLSQRDVLKITESNGNPGYILSLAFMDEGQETEQEQMTIHDAGDLLMALPYQRHARSFEVWASSSQVVINLWGPTKRHVKPLANHLQQFNPAIRQYRNKTMFPPLRKGATVRVTRMGPTRPGRHPIEHRFGRRQNMSADAEGITFPINRILNAIAGMDIPDGSFLVLQYVWRKNGYKWTWNPWCYLETRFMLGRNDEAIAWKATNAGSWYLDTRLVEIHTNPKHANTKLTAALGDAYSVYGKSNANSIKTYHLKHWSKRRVIKFIRGIHRRSIKPFRLKWSRKPHYAKDELGAFVQVPTHGMKLPGVMYSNVEDVPISTGQRAEVKALQKHLEEVRRERDQKVADDKARGSVRAMTSDEVQRLLRRERKTAGKP